MSEERLLQAPLPAQVLKALLGRLNVQVQPGRLARACDKAQRDLASANPVERLQAVLKELRLKGVQPALLRWGRFDLRRLPAMLFFDDRWQLAERGEGRKVRLTFEAGQSRDYEVDALEGAVVLWLRVAPQGEEVSVFSLRGNIAARMVLRALFRRRRWVGDIFIATVMINLLAVSTSLFAMQVYDRVVPTLSYATLWTLVAGMGIVISLDWLLKGLRARTLDSVAAEVDKKVSQQVFDHVMRLRLDTRPRSLGTLSAQVGGLDSVRQFFSSGVVFSLVDMPFALMFIFLIYVIGGPVSGVYLLLLPVAVALGLITQRRLRRLLKQQMMRANERQGLLVDSIRGAESIRSTNATWRFSEEWRAVTTSVSRYSLRQKAISSLATISTGSMSTLAYVSALVVGVGQIEAGSLTMGGLIACSILGGRVIAPIAQGVQHLAQWQQVAQALQMVNAVLALDGERRPDQNLLMPEVAPKRVELEGVRFSYPQSPVLQLDVSQLQFNAGDRVVLLGPVGSGKSTLLKVIAGFYRPSEGRVRLGDGDLWETDPNVVADWVGYLPQTVHLFKGTLRSNLALSGGVSDAHLLQVAADLGVEKIAAASPLGMEREISEGGDGLSEGQRQLVGLARLFVGQPRIWLLDEPTASLDNETEAKVVQTLQAYVRPEDILILSTHRPMLAAQLANRVLVVRDGEVVEDGKPEIVIPKLKQGRVGAARPRPGGEEAIAAVGGVGGAKAGWIDVI